MAKIALIGDIHHQFTLFDVAYFNNSDYDLLLCTGDLPFHGSQKDQELASRLAALEKPALLIPGNHDCVNMAQFIAEAKGITWLANASSPGQQELVEELRQLLDPVVMCGYSAHEFHFDGLDLCIIAGRPLSFGGPELRYRRYLDANFGVDSLNASAERLQELIDEVDASQILFLSHNGPTGLGSRPKDIWGCDFKPQAGDYGDPDLEAAVTYAKNTGRLVPAVIAGHMHHTLQNGGDRHWLARQNNTTYINAARVPRVIESKTQTLHHHIQLYIDRKEIIVEEKLIAAH